MVVFCSGQTHFNQGEWFCSWQSRRNITLRRVKFTYPTFSLKVILSRTHINYRYFIKSLLFKLPQYKFRSKQNTIPMSRLNRRTK